MSEQDLSGEREASEVVKLLVRQQEDALAFATKLVDGLHPLHCSDPGCLACAGHRKDAIGLVLTRDARIRAEAATPPEEGYRVYKDGDGWCAVGPGPRALRSIPFIGGTPIEALHGLLVREGLDRYRSIQRNLHVEED